MPQFIIERNIPGASTLSPDELRDISVKSCDVVAGLGHPIRGSRATWPATRSIACTRRAAPTPSASTLAKAAFLPTS